MKITDKFVFFWDGPYSQWLQRPMQIDGVMYSCCEQYMMEQKALLFNDKEAAKAIMKTTYPDEQKALGRQVKNFNRDMWDQHCMNIVFKANYAKFSQHPDLEKELRVTDNKIIVEASPTDKIWGIGMHETDPDVEDITKWRGLNLLGQAIMNVRAVLRYELYNA